MTKGEDGVYTGVLTLPKGTRFDLKILKSTVDGTSGGNNVWNAVRYASVLNSDYRYDFGEFTDNLVPNGDFEEGDVKWTPTGLIHENSAAHGGKNALILHDNIGSSDQFIIPPNQVLTCSFYFLSRVAPKGSRIMVKNVDTQSIMFEYTNMMVNGVQWTPFSRKFKSGDVPVKVQVVCEARNGMFDDISIISAP